MKIYQNIIQEINIENIINDKCYKALEDIIAVVRNHELSDVECFEAIEEIICIYEKLGVPCDDRHDF
ncbi:MAG: hypothetical protein R3Y12_02660 [Clostridia bacterium]